MTTRTRTHRWPVTCHRPRRAHPNPPGPDGPKFPGVQTFPPICGTNMLACGFTYDPGTGTWQHKGELTPPTPP